MQKLHAFLHEHGQHHVVTPNSEMLVASCWNPMFRQVLIDADLHLPDSAGLLFAARLTGQKLPERVTGIDAVTAFCRGLDSHTPVFLLGGWDGVADRAAQSLKEQNPNLTVVGTFAGSPHESDAQEIVRRINDSGAVILLVAYGAPQQDLWITRHLQDMPSVRIAMGVGGTFDFLAGTRVRSPQFLQRLRLEWLWRLVQEPSRLGRIWNAVVVFPILVLRHGKQAPSVYE
jgi:N-acetylglucosaminyldiphosphoundecaprenol N-acetyl-beta-D-mannosaminyltransferase